MSIFTTLQRGESIDYKPGSEKAAGSIIEQKALAGILESDLAADENGAITVFEKAYDLAKEPTTDTFAVGDFVWYDAANSRASKTPTDRLCGICIKAAAATDTIVKIKFIPFIPPAGTSDMVLEQENIAFGDFTDGGGASGYIDLTTQLPAGAVVKGWSIITDEGFTGNVSCVAQLGTSADADRFSGRTDGSVFTTGTISSLGNPATEPRCNSATTLRLTLTASADFTAVSAGNIAKIIVRYEMWDAVA